MIGLIDIAIALGKSVEEMEDLRADLSKTKRDIGILESKLNEILDSLGICNHNDFTERAESIGFDGSYGGVTARSNNMLRCSLPRGHSNEHKLTDLGTCIEITIDDLTHRAGLRIRRP